MPIEHPEKAIVDAADRRGHPAARLDGAARPRARLSLARAQHADACRPASCSGCGSRRRCARICSAWSTCSTSRRPDCIPADTEALLRALDRLKASGNSLFVVEHELDVIRHADWIVDVGPGGRRARRPRPLQRPARRARATSRSRRRARYLFGERRAARAHAARAGRLAAARAASRATTCDDARRRLPARRASRP